MGTDPHSRCAATGTQNDEPPPDAWALDFDDDQLVTVLDVSVYSSRFNAMAPGARYDSRFDFNMDGQINVLDLARYTSTLGQTCTP